MKSRGYWIANVIGLESAHTVHVFDVVNALWLWICELLSYVLIVVWLECEGPSAIHVPVMVHSCLQQKSREKQLNRFCSIYNCTPSDIGELLLQMNDLKQRCLADAPLCTKPIGSPAAYLSVLRSDACSAAKPFDEARESVYDSAQLWTTAASNAG